MGDFSPLAAPVDPSCWQGQLHLVFDRQSDKTILSQSRVQAPLKVQRPFYPEGDAICHSVLLHTAGGIVGGDRLSYQIQAQPQAQVLLTTAAATKVYRSTGKPAHQQTQITIAPGSCVEWLPQETILFNGALYRQDLRVDLGTDALWLGWDVTRLGRSARGERLETGEWRSKTEVWQGDRLLWVDPQWVQGGSAMLDSPHGLAGYPVIGSLAFLGQEVSPQVVEKARQLAGGITQGDWGTTRLMAGLLCRYRGQSTVEARRWLIQVWHLLRAEGMGRSGCLPRVWQLHDLG